VTAQGSVKKRLLSWTGERLVPWADEPSVIYEHLHRYLFSRQFVEGKSVLDLGSGEGYGSDVLAERAARVVGVEIDSLAAAHSRLNYDRPNLTFVEGSVLDLGELAEGSFDVAVCFEVIEHLSDHERLVSGVARVLKEDGLFIVSTPDRDVYNQALGHVNPYHLKELDLHEFEMLLSRFFPEVCIYGQRAVAGSLLAPMGPGASESREPARLVVSGDRGRWKVVPSPPPKYLVAIASRQALPPLQADSLLLDAGTTPTGQRSLRTRHPLLGEAVMVGRSVVHVLRRRAALVMRERNRKRESRNLG
jgi:O-antigen biosynthesis protein